MNENLEEKAKKRRRKEDVQRAVLAAVKVAGILSVAIVAPNILQAFPRLLGKQKYKMTFQAKTAVGRLLSGGDLMRDKHNMLRLTKKGERRLAIAVACSEKSARKKRYWDKRFRIVMFDIPQRRRAIRDRLRSLMRGFGFMRLQDSVWVSPYDCEELVTLVKAELRVGNDVLYAVVDQITGGQRIRDRFDLD